MESEMKSMAKLSIAAMAAVSTLGAAQAGAGEASTASSRCVGVVFNQEFIGNFPQAPAACQDVVERNGTKKIHFQARVAQTSRDGVTLDFMNAFGNPLPGKPLAFNPPPDLDLTVNGNRVKASQLKRGDVLDFWVPENMLGFHASPEANDLISFTLGNGNAAR
jgi:hypothetical protein